MSGGVIGGIAAMVIAVVWFVVAYFQFNTIFYYPPILFLIGLFQVGRGLMGGGRH